MSILFISFYTFIVSFEMHYVFSICQNSVKSCCADGIILGYDAV